MYKKVVGEALIRLRPMPNSLAACVNIEFVIKLED